MSRMWTYHEAPIEALRRAGVISDKKAKEVFAHLDDLERESSDAYRIEKNSQPKPRWWQRAR